ncbi:site-specific integrase [Mesorhizobium sp. M4A.F.Ca.ET.050.02.1.1]|uniref:integrase n=1 Tax=Mesorhizobium sp. M4A.F.Ca.ET.050.02.1.1 TaxID=2496754 RepID=UPI000FC9CA7F|nr:site-specific integrase [Mesorhizobium sp. M4A.F.Ca.ET.050.02.1.1]RUX49473.1 site-specific integrase [Mesorhizobium sp. M4A.F.Ca.ET.050.02.1.1]TIT95850.1 MAG: site-specific integrase [Mesorhizobium sp.]
MASIRKRNGKWNVQVRRRGHEASSKSFLAKSDALEWAREIERQLDRQELGPDRKTLKSITLAELVTRYKNEVLPKKRSARFETILLDRFLRYPIATKTLNDLQSKDFAQYRDQRLKEVSRLTGRPVTAKSLRRELAPLFHMFKVAKAEWHIPTGNPLQDLYLPAIDVRRERRLRPGEEERLLSEARKLRTLDGQPNPYLVPIIVFALETAMRQGEILAIEFRNVDFQRHLLTIPVSKNGHSRVIPLTDKASSCLTLAFAQPRGIIGPPRVTPTTRAFPVDVEVVKTSWTRICKRAEPAIEDLHFHDLRHEGISRLFELGLSIPEVASISGHRTPAMLFRYAHASQEAVRAKLLGKARRDEQKVIEGQVTPEETVTA